MLYDEAKQCFFEIAASIQLMSNAYQRSGKDQQQFFFQQLQLAFGVFKEVLSLTIKLSISSNFESFLFRAAEDFALHAKTNNSASIMDCVQTVLWLVDDKNKSQTNFFLQLKREYFKRVSLETLQTLSVEADECYVDAISSDSQQEEQEKQEEQDRLFLLFCSAEVDVLAANALLMVQQGSFSEGPVLFPPAASPPPEFCYLLEKSQQYEKVY